LPSNFVIWHRKGSGRWGAKEAGESGSLKAVGTVLDLRRDGYLQPPGPGGLPYTLTVTCGEARAAYRHRLDTLQVRRQATVVQCGYCGRRVVRLYIVQAVFACRPCHRLGYASQLEVPHDRGTGRARRIRLRLSDGTDDLPGFPSRPRFMHRTFMHRTTYYAMIADYFPRELAARANGALNLAHFGSAFAVQYGIGIVVGQWSSQDGHYPVVAYQLAFGLSAAFQAAALLWFALPWLRTLGRHLYIWFMRLSAEREGQAEFVTAPVEGPILEAREAAEW
jgi:hypothetical protein